MVSAAGSHMRAEALEAPARVAALMAQDSELHARLGERLRSPVPHGVVTLARGSSDHAAQHMAHLVMARLGHLVTSLPLLLLTLYGSPLRAPGLLALALSQSGRSPDLVEPTQLLRAGGACAQALVNETESALATAAEHVLPLQAGIEHSVAATAWPWPRRPR